MITDDQLRAIMPQLSGDRRALLLPHLQAAMAEFHITTTFRMAAFLAQLAHESNELRRFEESLNYGAQGLRATFPSRFSPAEAAAYARQPVRIANRAYALKNGNGNEASGDGWRYRGRGPIQITGRGNYKTYGDIIGVDIVSDPDRASSPDTTFRIAGAFWHHNGLNELADREAFEALTARINAKKLGLAERLNYYRKGKQVLSAGGGTRGLTGDMRGADATPPQAGTAGPPLGFLPRGFEEIEAERDEAAGHARARKSAAKKAAGKKTAAKKAGARKGAAQKSGSKKAGGKSGASKKGAGKSGGSKKGGSSKGGGGKKAASGKGGSKKAGGSKKGGGKKGGSKNRR